MSEKPKTGQPDQAYEVRHSSSANGTVYFVDDQVREFQFVVEAGRMRGHHVVLCENVAEFKSKFDPSKARAIFANIRIGTEHATDIIDLVKEHRGEFHTYLVSGDLKSIAIVRRYAGQVGVLISGVLTKPFTGTQVIDLASQIPFFGTTDQHNIDVDECFRNGWLSHVIQPKFDVTSKRINSGELLIRFDHPNIGKIRPDIFIKTLCSRQKELIFLKNVELSIEYIRSNFQSQQNFEISINVECDTLFNCADQIRYIEEQKYISEKIVLEITESEVFKLDQGNIRDFIKMNVDRFKFSIDDFGKGMSNYARLVDIPAYELKIDRSLVHGCSACEKRGIVMNSIIHMARQLGLRTVAEGVEDVSDFIFATAAGVTQIQGYLIAQPLEVRTAERFVREFNDRELLRGNAKNISSLLNLTSG